jgi:hypothetical protein
MNATRNIIPPILLTTAMIILSVSEEAWGV